MLKVGCAALVVVAGSASGQVNLKGLQWAHVGNAGNAPVPASISPNFNAAGYGVVDHEFHITTTPVTVENWFDFVLAWAPYHQNHFTTGFSTIGGGGIDYDALTGRWSIIPGTERGPASAGWRLAAIYANWLHNDQRTDEEAFLSGAYDVRTFGGSGFSLTDQFEPSPGARFWIPTRDEWIKSMYHDPDRYGPGEEGYWLYPHGSDAQPVPGAPGVGDTNIGWGIVNDVGSYPNVLSPYGLLDGASGIAKELSPSAATLRVDARSKIFAAFDLNSHIVYGADSGGHSSSMGFRLASRIPSPSSCIIVGAGWFAAASRRRKVQSGC